MNAGTTSQPGPRKGIGKGAHGEGKGQPEWANGLKRLYDSVVEEDLPDSFKDLLAQLDKKD